MHELGILYHVVEQVLKVVAQNGITEVEAVVLQVGELSAVVPKYLYSCYPAAVDGTMLETAALEVETLPANAICHGCDEVFSVLQNGRTCPHCGETDTEIISGRELYIKEIRGC